MISNDAELATVEQQLRELRSRKERTLADKLRDPFSVDLVVSGFEKMIARLQAEVDEYEARLSHADASNRP